MHPRQIVRPSPPLADSLRKTGELDRILEVAVRLAQEGFQSEKTRLLDDMR
jgi:hypothetical protein